MGSGTWPPNRGFIKATPITLTPGMKIDRYGDFIDGGYSMIVEFLFLLRGIF